MKEITLTKGYRAIVDDDDYEWLSQFKWHAAIRKSKVYAARSVSPSNGLRSMVYMHRAIIGMNDVEVDHRDADGLNNARKNLRTATRAQNNHNRLKIGGTSQYKGVSHSYRGDRWYAHIHADNKTMFLGSFATEIEAAKAYDAMAIKIQGVFARPNFPQEIML
jgi:hypothetical protein